VKVLLDEQLPHRLRKLLGAHDVYTVDYMGWAALKNGELLRAAESDGFEVFLTGDKNLAYQQNMAGFRRQRRGLACATGAIRSRTSAPRPHKT
jgi:hypothetical protein